MLKQDRKKRTAWIIAAAVLVVALVAGYTALNYVFTGGRFYAISGETLDLRGEELTLADYDKIAKRASGATILWDVPFQDGVVENTVTELTVTTLSDADVLVLDYLPQLKTVHGEQCPDCTQLAALQQRRPECSVLYSVTISGKTFDQDTAAVSVVGLTQEDEAKLASLLCLDSVEISGCTDYELLQRLQQDYPQWNLSYTVTLGDGDYAWDSVTVEATGATYEELSGGLSGLPELTQLLLINPLAQAEELLSLQQTYSHVAIDWQVELYGLVFPSDTQEVDISGNLVDSCEEVEQLVACLPQLEKLVMSDCGIDSETMAEFRERQRENYKVVWTVYMGDKCKARTDDIYFMPIQQGEYYFNDTDALELKYCEDMICLDLGHHPIHNIDFVAYMPHLKYLILAHTGVRDVSPIVSCQELIYLEVDWSEIQSYEPIAELKALEDINLEMTYCDITPFLEMTWLKNLWAPGRTYAEGVSLKEALPDTNVVLTDKTPAGQGWRNLPNYYAMRDILGMPYME